MNISKPHPSAFLRLSPISAGDTTADQTNVGLNGEAARLRLEPSLVENAMRSARL